MKTNVTYGYIFTPGAQTLELSTIPSFDIKKLVAVINLTRRKLIYAVASSGLGYSTLTGGNVLTLDFNTAGQNAADELQIIYDDPGAVQQTNVINEIVAATARYLASDPTLSDGDAFRLRVNSKGELIVESRPSVIANFEDIEFPDVQPVIGDRVNNESVSQYAVPTDVPEKVTVIGGLFGSNSEVYPVKVDDDGSVFVKPGSIFPVSGPLTNTELRAAPVPVSGPLTDSQLRAAPVPTTLPANQTVNQTQVGGTAVSLGRKSAALSIPHVMANEDILDQFITGFGPTTSPINTNLLNAVSGTGSLDCQQYRSIAFQINAAASTTAVTVNFEVSNDNVNFVPVTMFDKASPQNSPITSYNTAAGVVRYFEGPVYFRYFRARIGAAIVAGSAQGFTMLRMAPFTNPIQFIGQGSSMATLTTVSTVSNVNSVISGNLASAFITVLTSTTITTSTTSAGINTANVQTNSYQVNVTAVSGTNPTLDVSIEESFDNGATWFKVYDFERITAVGQYRSPPIAMSGSTSRIVRTVGGTTPSFTTGITGASRASVLGRTKRIINRTIDPNTLNSTTAALEVRDCSKIQIVQSSQAAGIAATLTLQGSEDGVSWYDLPCALMTAMAASVTSNFLAMNMSAFVRLRVSTAGTGNTLNYISITAQ